MRNKFFKAIDILHLAKQSGIKIILNDDQLQLTFTQNKNIDKDLLEDIRGNKQIIIDYLANKNFKFNRVEKGQQQIAVLDRKSVEHLPLSFSQERLWFIDQLEGSVQYHLPTVLRLKGKLNIAALEFALSQVVSRHEILRTVIGEVDGIAVQHFKAKDGWRLNIDTDQLVEDQNNLQAYINALISEPFNLREDYMLRAQLLKTGAEEHVLVVTLHHIASDAWSVSVIVKEVVELYTAYEACREPKLSPLPVQYADYASWQRNYLQGEVLATKLGYWQDKLSGVSPLQLPLDHARPAVQSIRGAVAGFSVDKELSDQLQSLSRGQGATMFMTLLAAFNVLLQRYSGQQDICIGTPVAGRRHQQVEELIGFFINTLVLRTDLSQDPTFISLLQQVRGTTLEAYDHQDVPFEKLVETIVKERDMSRSPLFQVMFILQNTPEVPVLQLGDVVLSREAPAHQSSKFELTFNIQQTPQGLQGAVEYCTNLFTEQTIARMIGHFTNLLKAIAAAPDQKISSLKMLDAAEAQQLLVDFNATHVSTAHDKMVTALFEAQVIKTPGNPALVFEQTELSYAALNERSNQLAHYLRSQGVKEETLVPVFIDRGIGMVTAILGILKSGAAYVPIDPAYPQERISYLLEDTGATIIISNEKNIAGLPQEAAIQIINLDSDQEKIAAQPINNVPVTIHSNQLAYIIYTSGSTGRPKGVMIEHGRLLSYLLNDKTNYSSEAPGNAGSFIHLSYTFDASLTGMLMPLLKGRSVVIGSGSGVDVFEDSNLQKYAPYDFIKITPSHLELLQPKMRIADGRLLTNKLVIGGEALLLSRFDGFVSAGLDVTVVNEYGPTEATVGCSVYSFNTLTNPSAISSNISIGKPIDNVELYILGDHNELLPVGVTGELCIAGAGLARGYLNRPELTAVKFVTNPFAKEGKEGTALMYRTGDLAKWQSDGNISYQGRKDEQVKIRGYRVELGEIETVLEECPLVKQGVVLAKAHKDGSKYLAGYVVANDFDKGAIQLFLENKLPEYMVPRQWVSLESFPVTINGKIDRKALPDPDMSGQQGRQYIAPRNTLEAKLVSTWEQLLDVRPIGIEDNFFELGGHSLLAMRLVSAIRKELEVEVSIKNLFTHATIAALAAHLQTQDKATLLPPIEAHERPEHLPLSFSQERLWFIDQLEGSVQYHLPTVLRLKGKLNIAALEFALSQVVSRHEILRTVIREKDGEGFQYIKDKDGWNLKITDGALFEKDEADLQNAIKKIISHPFNLAEDYMLRAELVVLNEIENVLVVTLHHIASDGWSSSIIVKELVELYKAFEEGGPALPPLKIQYADYAIWQRDYLRGEVLEKKLAYWKNQLQGVAALQLPTDYARPAVQSTKGATAGFVLDKAISDQLVLLSQQQGTTLFMTMLAVFKVLLYRYTGQQDICVGTPIAGRHQQELESLMGFFINTIALRSALQDDASFTALLQQVKTTTLEAYDHQDMPFEKIVDAVSRERDMSRSPLFQVMFIMQNTPAVPDFKLGDVSLVKQPLKNTSAKFDITFYVAESPDGLQGIMEYCTDLFHEATIERMLGHFKELLNAVVISPHQKIGALPMLNNNEEQEILVQFNDTAKTLPVEKTVIGLFETQVEKTPAAIALVFEERQMSYEELNQLANNLAHELRHRGAKPGMLVPVCIERSLEMAIAILGVLKSGAAYVPIDADYPEERIRFMLDDTAATLMVTDKKFAAKFESDENVQVIIADSYGHSVKWPNGNLSSDVGPDPLIAVIYTSGSSGRPKGVKLGNAGLVNRMYWMWDAYPFGPNEKCALKTSIGFVDHMWELFGPLAKGITAVLFKKEELLDLDSLLDKLSIHKITRWVLVPSLLRTLLEKIAFDHITLDSLQYWTCSGEAITANLVKDFYALFPAASHRLLNIYGSSEVTADVTCYDTSIDFVQPTDNVKNHGKVPIGKPIANTQVYIVDNAGRLVAKGVTGEILIGGVQLAKGYLNLPGLTAEKFIQNPFNREEGAILFRTGDMGCWLPDGNISYLGRKDDQLKIRGNRVEPGEIEGLLKQSGLVNNAVVVTKDDHHGDKRLIGYVVAEGAFNKEAAQAYLKKRLPDYMVPAAWMVLESLPLTHNGKLDKKALPEPGTVELTGASYLAPRNELECRLAEIWKEILHVEQVGVYDNFFELGGHSLLAIRLVSAIRRKLELELIINDIFIYPTIATFADNIIEKVKNPSMPIVNIKYLVSIKSGGNKIPLYIVCGAGGTALRFKKFSDMLDTDQPVFVLQPPIDSNTKDFPASFEEIARVFIDEILIQNPAGPFALSGHCLGGFIAFEMARQLEAMGKKVHLLAMFDSIIRESEKYESPSIGNLFRSGYLAKKYFKRILLKFDFETFLLKNHTRHAIKYKVNAIARLFTKMRWKKVQPKQFEFAGLEVFGESSKIYISASKNYKLAPYPGDVVLFYAREHYYFMDRSINVEFRKLDLDETTKNNWKEFAVAVKVHDVAGEHSTIFDPVHGDEFARLLQQHLNEGALQYSSQV